MLEKYGMNNKDLKLSTIEGMFASLMFGGGVVFIVPFALFLGATSLEIGFLSAFPALLAAWIQLLSIKLLEVYGSRRNIVVFTVAIQALTWLPIAFITILFPEHSVFWLIVFYTFGTLVGAISGPIWQSWMKSITPSEIFSTYFGARNALTGGVVFLVSLISGLLLGLVKGDEVLLVFMGIFLVSFFGRIMSAIIFTKISDPPVRFNKKNVMSFRAFIKEVSHTEFGYFLLFGGLMSFAIAFTGPFIAVLYLKELGASYFIYTLIVASGTIATIISMPYWGKLMDKHGTIKVLKGVSFLVALWPLTFILIRNVELFIITELFGGVLFAGFNLAMANFVYNVSTQSKIVRFASYQAVLFGTAAFAGTMISGYIQSHSFSFGIISNSFYLVCVISLIIRLITYFSLKKKLTDVLDVQHISDEKIVFSVLTLSPIRQTIFNYSVYAMRTGIQNVNSEINKIKRKGIEKINKIKHIHKKGKEILTNKNGTNFMLAKQTKIEKQKIEKKR